MARFSQKSSCTPCTCSIIDWKRPAFLATTKLANNNTHERIPSDIFIHIQPLVPQHKESKLKLYINNKLNIWNWSILHRKRLPLDYSSLRSLLRSMLLTRPSTHPLHSQNNHIDCLSCLLHLARPRRVQKSDSIRPWCFDRTSRSSLRSSIAAVLTWWIW